MYGAMRYIGFPFSSSCISSFIQCAALLLDQDKVHNDVKIFQKSISRFKIRNFQFLCIDISEAMELVSPRLLEAVEQAQFSVYCYHARLNNVTFADVGHSVVQVSGAADQDVEDSFLEMKRLLSGKNGIFLCGQVKNIPIVPTFF